MPRNNLILTVTVLALTCALGWRARPSEAVAPAGTSDSRTAVPRMVELGSDSCASCRAMIPVLAELREKHAGVLDVDFIDVWEFPDDAEPFDVRVIPTQVFLAPDGSELARHEGFFAADSIREKWASLGYSLASQAPTP